MVTELECELCPLIVAFREGGQFLSLPTFLPHLILVTSCMHTAGGRK